SPFGECRMDVRFEILTLADEVISSPDLSRDVVFIFVQKLRQSVGKLSIGDRECVSAACKNVIGWLNKQETQSLDKRDWFSIVRKLCTAAKDDNGENVSGEAADISQEIHRTNVSHLCDSNVVLRLIRMCFSEEESFYEEKMEKEEIDFKDWYGRISLLCSFLECGWERLKIDQANALRYSALTILRMIPTISTESEKIFIRSILRVVNKIVHLVAGYEGHQEFSDSAISLYIQVIRKTVDERDQEHVVASLIMNLNGLDQSDNSKEIMELMWEMLTTMCARLREERKEKKEKKKISPHADFHRSLDIWLSNFIQATIQDSLEEKVYRKEEVCNWIISTLTMSSYNMKPPFDQFITVVRTCLSLPNEHSNSLSSSLSRLYTKLMNEKTYGMHEQSKLVDAMFEIWNGSNESSVIILLNKILDGNCTRELSLRAARQIMDHLECNDKEDKAHIMLSDVVYNLGGVERAELARVLVNKINEMEISRNDEKSESRLMEILTQLNILIGLKKNGNEERETRKWNDTTAHLAHFNDLLGSEEYTRMMGVGMKAYFGMDRRRDMRDPTFLPPINVEYAKRIVNGEKLLSYHHLHYFQVHAALSKSKEYLDYLIEINGGLEMEAHILELCLPHTMDRMVQSMLKIMLNVKEMYPLPLSSQYTDALSYMLECLGDGTLSVLSATTLKQITAAISSAELRYVLNELSTQPQEREVNRPRMLKLIQIAKMSMLSHEERSRLLDGVIVEVNKAIWNVVNSYKDKVVTTENLAIQHILLAILRCHIGVEELDTATRCWMDSYLRELKLSNPPRSFELLVSYLMSALCESPTFTYPMESNGSHFGLPPISPYITTPLMDRFSRLLLALFSISDSKFLPPIDWNVINKAMISVWLDSACSESGSMITSLPLLVVLSNIVQGENMRNETRSLVIEYLHDKGPSFVIGVVRASPCKPVFFHVLIPIIKYLRAIPEISSGVDEMIVECIPIAFMKTVCDMQEFYPVVVQSTDRYAQTQLNWRSLSFPVSEEVESKDGKVDPIHAMFTLFAELSTFKRVVFTMLETLGNNLEEWLSIGDDEIMMLRGITVSSNTQIIWKVQLISEALAYMATVAEMTRERAKEAGGKKIEEETIESDDEQITNNIFVMEEKKEESPSLCTFVSTCKEFTKQHWYNCYTCNMIESEGVCTVCALNCHRGHDLSYSKLGSFFCDCGAKKCLSTRVVTHPPPVKRIRRLKEVKKEKKYIPTIPLPHDITIDEVTKYLGMSQKSLALDCQSLNDLILGIEVAYEGKFAIESRREEAMRKEGGPCIKYDESIMVGKMIENDGLEQLDRRMEGMEANESNPAKECSELIRLIDGSSLFLYVSENSPYLSLIYMGVSSCAAELGDTRVERETLPFTPKRISVKGDHIAITGVDQAAFMRVSVETGDIIQKEFMGMKETSNANPIVKAVWFIDDTTTVLAISTLQFVRIYRMFKDVDKFEVELVLPLGNVIDLTFIKKKDADYLWIVVLCSAGNLYYHQIGGPGLNVVDDSRSLYLTSTLPVPVESPAMSLHYSQLTSFLYVSFHNALFCARLDNGDIMELEFDSYRQLGLEGVESWVGWRESNGIVAAVSKPAPSNKVLFVYPTLNDMLVQVAPLAQSAHSICLAPSSSFDSMIALAILSGYRRPAMLFTSNWANQPDLWMDHRPMKMEKIAMVEEETGQESTLDQLVTLFEKCSEVREVEYTSSALETYYSSVDLTHRLLTPEKKSIVSVNNTTVDITISLSKRHYEIRGLRLEIDGSCGPKSLSYNGNIYTFVDRRLKRIYDIPLSPNDWINSERSLEIRLDCLDEGITSIISLRPYGDSREDTFARCLAYPPLSLPYQLVFHSLRMINELLEYDLQVKTHILVDSTNSREWIPESALLVASPRACRPMVSAAALKVLRKYWGRGEEYYIAKDRAVIAAFAQFFRYKGCIVPPVIIEFLSQLRHMVDKRYESFINNTNTFFGNALSLVSFLRWEMGMMAGEDCTVNLILSFFLHLCCTLLSKNHSESQQLMRQIVIVLTSHKTYRMWKRVREELRGILRNSLDGIGLQNGEWIGRLVRVFTHKIARDMEVSIPMWSKMIDEVEWNSIDTILKRDICSFNGVIGVAASLIKEMEKDEIVKILVETIDYLDVTSLVTEEEEVRQKRVRATGVITLLRDVCMSIGKKTDMEERDWKEGDEEEDEEREDEEMMMESNWIKQDGQTHEMFNDIVYPLLEDDMRKDKVMGANFLLLEEVLAFRSRMKEKEKWVGTTNEGNFHGGVGRMTTLECIVEYYSIVARSTLDLPTLFLCPHRPIVNLSEDRKNMICEFLMVDKSIELRNNAKKLLFRACNSDKRKYSQKKNEFIIMRNLNVLRFEYLTKFSYSHEESTAMMEKISQLSQIANEKSECWRKMCEKNLKWLLLLTSKVVEPVAAGLLELIQAATKITRDDNLKESRSSQPPPSPADFSIADSLFESVDGKNLLKVVMVKYLVGRDESLRWLVHSLCRSLMQLAKRSNQILLCNMLFYEVLPIGRRLGERAAQLGDLCSAYLPILLPSTTLLTIATDELLHLETMIDRLERSEHAGASTWMVDAGMSWKDTLHLTPDQCIDCLHPNETMEALKISGIKAEARYTTNSLMYKLNGHYEISKVIVKLADIKRTRMFRRVNVYYTNDWIESAVELKSEREKWKMVAHAKVSPSDTEVVLSITIPILTNALVIELTDVKDSRVKSELHCPRCSALVRPNPGVCDNCGENVYQCVKCRVINYDEKEPFLCSSCGYCKYARMEMSVVGRIQPMMNISADNDKPMASRAVTAINKLEWEMDSGRCEQRLNWIVAQSLTIRHSSIPVVSYPVDGRIDASPELAPIHSTNSRWNALNELMRWTRNASDSLVSQSLQLINMRESMKNMEEVSSPALHAPLQRGYYNASEHGCIGCLTSSIIHSISFLRSLCDNVNICKLLTTSSLIYHRLVVASNSIDILRDEVECLMVRLCQTEEGVDRLCKVVIDGGVSPSTLALSMMSVKKPKWNERMDTLVETAMIREDDDTAHIALLNVLLESIRDGKNVLMIMEERKTKMRWREMEKGALSINEKEEQRKMKTNKRRESDGDWNLIDSILNSEKNIGVDEMEKEKKRIKMEGFVWKLMFSRSIFVRSLSCRLVRAMMSTSGQAGAVISICLLGLSYGREVSEESRCHQFFLTFNCLIERGQIKLRLFQSHFHLHLMGIILSESVYLRNWERREGSVSDSSGVFLYHCTNLLTNVLSGTWFESLLLSSSLHCLIVPLLHSCILLTRVTIKRNRPIARALRQLDNLLRRCTAKEGLSLLTVSVVCLSRVEDEKSRSDVVGVILETLDPREKQSDEFLIQVEKDAAQEDFLQGRMQHNPYKSGDVSMGPLMRNIKDKICRECELIALLEDDNGMELLVNGKIISLSLPVKLVYDKVWRPSNGGEAMVIVYRMRGLLGDAIEPFVDSIDETREGERVGEVEAELLNTFLSSGGVSTTLDLLSNCTLSPNGCILLVQLRKLMTHLLKIDKIKINLLEGGCVSILLNLVKRIKMAGLHSDQSMQATQLHLLRMICDDLVSDTKHHPMMNGISGSECEWLFSLLVEDTHEKVKEGQMVQLVTKILANAVLGSNESEDILVRKFKEGLNWEELMMERMKDSSESADDEVIGVPQSQSTIWMEKVEREADIFTLIADGIQSTEKGKALKGRLIEAGIINDAVNALLLMHPPLYGTVESPEWKTYLSRPSLKLILRLLKGMAKGDERSQLEIAKRALPILHRLEQVSSAEHLGTIAEKVMESLSENKEVSEQIDRVRKETKEKKRQMAMAMREKQLSKLGMAMGRRGEVKVASRSIVNEPAVEDASDPLTSCCICRESIVTGTRVPATYAYASSYRQGEGNPTHCSVSLSVMVHTDCHHNAIRRSNGGRNSDEWTKASLHNSGARCNIVVPINVADPSIADWNASVSRLESDLEVIVPGGGVLTRYRVFKDMSHLIRKFILNRSFAESSGGGGRESNMQYLAVLHLLALSLPEGELVCNVTSERLNSFLLTELTVTHWNGEKMDVLRAFLRDIRMGEERGAAREILLSQSLLQWAFIDLYFNRVIPIDGEEDRLVWLRSNFTHTLTKTVQLVKFFDTTLLPIKNNEELAKIIGVDLKEVLSLSTVTTPE
ncbi:hypothetical protein PFISCL1PPCAC_19872, partial [Pristionchus fissidentatus]